MAENSNVFKGEVNILEPKIKTLVFYPKKDTWVDSDNPFYTFGADRRLRVNNITGSDSLSYFTFEGIDFDSLGINKDEIVSAQFILRTTQDNTENLDLSLTKITDVAWDEYNLTYPAAPTMGNTITSTSVQNGDSEISFNLIYDLRNNYSKYQSDFGFGMKADTTTSTNPLECYSKESYTDKPMLVITYYDYSYNPIENTLPLEFEVITPGVTAQFGIEFEAEELPKTAVSIDVPFEFEIAKKDLALFDFSFQPVIGISAEFGISISVYGAEEQNIAFEFTPVIPVSEEFGIEFTPEAFASETFEFEFTPVLKVDEAEIAIEFSSMLSESEAFEFEFIPLLDSRQELEIGIMVVSEQVLKIKSMFKVETRGGKKTYAMFV